MPLLYPAHDALPHLDREPTNEERSAITTLLTSSLPPDHGQTLHPSVPVTYTPIFSPLLTASHDTIASTGSARDATTGIDLSRYEEPTAPDSGADATAWHAPLHAAYTSLSYLSARQTSLALLERYGRNAWLIANAQVEAELMALERELNGARDELQIVEEQRRRRQIGLKGEVEGLDEAWRTGLGRAIEAEVAGEGLRREALDRRRNAAAVTT